MHWVAAQGSVPHSGVAMATVIVLVWTEIGGAAGNAIGGRKLDVSGAEAQSPVVSGRTCLSEFLPSLDEAAYAELFVESPLPPSTLGDPIRTGVIQGE